MKRILLCSGDIPKGISEILETLRYEVMRIPESHVLAKPVALHPDMLFSLVGKRTILTDKAYCLSNAAFFKALEEKGVKVTVSKSSLSEKYPLDILFDAIKTEKLLIGNLKYTAPELFSDGITCVNVKQGYALCSTALLKDAAITADKGIADALEENGYDVLRISPGGIALNGYDFGFIGGASAVLEDAKAVVFFGDIKRHPSGNDIILFCKKNGYKVYFDDSFPLTDYGGAKELL